MDKEHDSELLEHVWRYFELHAGQRMSLFNFFVALAGVAGAGIAASLTAARPLPAVAGILGLMLVLTAIVFGKLDQRVCFLMGQAEKTGARVEERLFHNAEDRLFQQEPGLTASAAARPGLAKLWTYGRSFSLVFWAVGILGALASTYSLASMAGWA